MDIKSAKAKGARLVKELREALLNTFQDRLAPGDICVVAANLNGPDLYLSPKAREFLNMQFECKNQERLQLWKSIDQSEKHCQPGEIPILCFRRNREEPKVALPLHAFLTILKDAKRELE